MQESGSDELSLFLTQRGYILSLWGLMYLLLMKGEMYGRFKEICYEKT
ncbi:hypothetical protein BAZOLSSOX_1880 [uncultured Gammaproteobacteria bacterium]|nr:hypothetical protein BAZOLSSOX_1880 [uncultured Gammaproteobacteria bacterium]